MKLNSKLTESELYNTISDKDKVLFILYDYPNSTTKDISNKCYPDNTVTSVTSVPPVTSVTSVTSRGNTSNKNNKGNRVTTITDKVKVYLSRLFDDKYINKGKSTIPNTYSLTQIAIEYIEDKYNQYQKEIRLIIQKKTNESKEITTIKTFQSYFQSVRQLPNILACIRQNKAFILDFSDLLHFDPDSAEYLLDEPEEALKCAEIAIEQNENAKITVLLKNPPKSAERNITHLRVRDVNKLVYLNCEIKSRATSAVITTSIKFECPSCGNQMVVHQLDSTGKLTEPSFCGCGRKGKFRTLERKREDYLRITVSDLYSNLTSSEVPEEINVILQQDYFMFEKLAEGDRVKLTGILNLCDTLSRNGQKTTIEQKIIKTVGIEKLDKDFDKVFLTEEDEKQFETIRLDPIKWHRQLLFSDLKDIELAETLNILQLYGNFHVLQIGKPGIGKSESSKRISQVAVRGSFCNCINATPSGLLGATTKNNFTGKFTLDGGVFKRMHPNGIVVCDEINRGSEDFLQPALLGIMNDKRLNVKKANVDLDVPCDISISATANKLRRYDSHSSPYEVFGLIEPLWDRFDFKLYYNNSIDFNNIDFLGEIVSQNRDEFKLPENEMEIIKKYQIKSRMIDVKFTKEDHNKMAIVLHQFYSGDTDSGYRPIRTIKSLLSAICKIHHRQRPINEDYAFATDLVLALRQAESKFKATEMAKE